MVALIVPRHQSGGRKLGVASDLLPIGGRLAERPVRCRESFVRRATQVDLPFGLLATVTLDTTIVQEGLNGLDEGKGPATQFARIEGRRRAEQRQGHLGDIGRGRGTMLVASDARSPLPRLHVGGRSHCLISESVLIQCLKQHGFVSGQQESC